MLATSVPLMLLQWSRGCEAAEAPPIVTLLLSRNCNPLCEHLTIFRITHETNGRCLLDKLFALCALDRDERVSAFSPHLAARAFQRV